MNLFDDLPEGVIHLERFVSHAEQRLLLEHSRDIFRITPGLTPVMRDGTPFKIKISSCGDCGWYSDRAGYRYALRHPVTGKPWPPMPEAFSSLVQRVSAFSGISGFEPDTCLINWYPRGEGRLGLHVDNTERELTHPIYTASIGDSCSFMIGGVKKADKLKRVTVGSGDVIVMHGPARLYWHGVDYLLPAANTPLTDGGRISLTFRRAL